MRKILLTSANEHVLQAELAGQQEEVFQRLEDNTLAQLMTEDDNETLNFDEAKQYYGDQLCTTNN
jgi:hypothetical protein